MRVSTPATRTFRQEGSANGIPPLETRSSVSETINSQPLEISKGVRRYVRPSDGGNSVSKSRKES